jgi:hypothetical protein
VLVEVSNTEAENNMNRKTLLFAGILFLVLLVKYTLGQDENGAGWEPASYDDPAEWIFSVMMLAPILGAAIGAMRVLAQRSARPVVEPICLVEKSN